MSDKVQESAEAQITTLSRESWEKIVADAKAAGEETAKKKRGDGHYFEVDILAPHIVLGGDSIKLEAVKVPLDWRLAKRKEMVALARDFLTSAYVCYGRLDPAIAALFRAIIEGKKLHVTDGSDEKGT